jgi:hypothetical protein
VCTENKQIGSTDAENVKKKETVSVRGKEKNARSDVGLRYASAKVGEEEGQEEKNKRLMHDRPTEGRCVCGGRDKTR